MSPATLLLSTATDNGVPITVPPGLASSSNGVITFPEKNHLLPGPHLLLASPDLLFGCQIPRLCQKLVPVLSGTLAETKTGPSNDERCNINKLCKLFNLLNL